jgi:hypothetical protein
VDQAIANPFYGIQIGSTASAESGKLQFHALSVFNDGLTTVLGGTTSVTSMSGNSHYVYNERMNQGSVSVSGAYGLGSVARLGSSISAYVGKTSAESQNNLTVNYECKKLVGVEQIDFNRFHAGQIIAGLKGVVRERLLEVLDKYTAMTSKIDPGHLFEILEKKGEGDEAKKAFREWQSAANKFLRDYGTGVVVGVAWGGWGTVSLELVTTNREDRWEGSGSATFTCAGTGAAVDVAATYGGSESWRKKISRVHITGYCNGRCMEDVVNAWLKDLQAKALDTLTKENPAQSSALTKTPTLSKAPDLIPNRAPESLTKKIGQIKDLNGLEAYAKAAAWEKFNADHPDDKVDLATFLKTSGEKARAHFLATTEEV